MKHVVFILVLIHLDKDLCNGGENVKSALLF